jgi:hypothetical protein
MQEESLDEFYAGSHEAVELRATWQGREGTVQVSLGVPVEVPLASEAAPAGEDSQGYDLARTERDASGPGTLFGARDWQNSSTVT